WGAVAPRGIYPAVPAGWLRSNTDARPFFLRSNAVAMPSLTRNLFQRILASFVVVGGMLRFDVPRHRGRLPFFYLPA
ncbi:MAG TPA: hypothetical protein VF746_04420, partial [Longimicrobium sp.]